MLCHRARSTSLLLSALLLSICLLLSPSAKLLPLNSSPRVPLSAQKGHFPLPGPLLVIRSLLSQSDKILISLGRWERNKYLQSMKPVRSCGNNYTRSHQHLALWGYRINNWIHKDTTSHNVSQQLFFSAGQCSFLYWSNPLLKGIEGVSSVGYFELSVISTFLTKSVGRDANSVGRVSRGEIART